MQKEKGMSKRKNDQIQDAKSKNHQKLTTRQVSATASFIGPLPPPSILKQYDEVNPGLANRIVRMAETEADHRRQIEKKALDADIRFADKEYIERRIGQFLGFGIGVIALIVGAVVAIHGQPWAGSFIGTGGVVGLVTAFIYGRRAAGDSNSENHKSPVNQATAEQPPTDRR
jgi:uncharacterized membrane protein